MIYGAHAIIYSTNAEADRAFVRDVLKYRFADAGHGWQIFALPPAELAFHPSEKNDVHELYLMCDDVQDLIADMTRRGIPTTPVHEERWGLLTRITLPSGGKLGIYQPKHASPLTPTKAKPTARKTGAKKTGAKKTAAKKTAAKKTAAKKRKPSAKRR
jgi:hypothetical protein